MNAAARPPMGRVLIVAGSDSGGGAGIQADIKTVTALGGYASTAITAVTVQNTLGVTGIHEIPPGIIADQMRAVLDDIGADTVKTGMLHSAAVVQAVAQACMTAAQGGRFSVVCDPVMVAKGGARLLEASAVDALRRLIIPHAAVVTPNLPEAEVLTGRSIASRADMETAADALLETGAGAVLLKGGHLDTGDGLVHDLLKDRAGTYWFRHRRIETRHTHGTGCTLASAVAALLAQGQALDTAAATARRYVARAMETAPGLGAGHGPLNHMLGKSVAGALSPAAGEED